MEPDKKLIAEVVKNVLAAHPEDKLPKSVTLEEFVEYFSSHPYPVSLETQSIRVELSFQTHELISYLVSELKERFAHVPIKLKGVTNAELDLERPENQTMLRHFAEVAASLFLATITAKISGAIDTLCEQSLGVAIQICSGNVAKGLSRKYDFIPDRLDLRPFIEQVNAQEAARNKKWITEIVERIGHDGLNVASTKGRPRTWTKEGLRQAVGKACLQFRKDKYRAPTLNDVANSLNRKYPDRMKLNAKSLGQILKRYDIDWKEIKNPQN